MSGYIHLDKDLLDDPRVVELAEHYVTALAQHLDAAGLLRTPVDERALRDALRAITRNASVGALTRLWAYADTHIRADDTLPLALDRLAEICLTPVEWLQQLPGEWLQTNTPTAMRLPDYVEKNCLIAREDRRRKGRERARRFRLRHKLDDVASDSKNVTRSNNACNADSRGRVRARTRARPHPHPTPHPQSLTPYPLLANRAGVAAEPTKQHRRSAAIRAESLRIWKALLVLIDEIQHSAAGLTWAHVEKRLANRNAFLIAERIGFRNMAERTRATEGEHKRRFRDMYEQLLERAQAAKLGQASQPSPERRR